jgi:hypothetical protein
MGVAISIIFIVALHIFLKKIDLIRSENEKLLEKFGIVSKGVLEQGEETPFKLDTVIPFDVKTKDFQNYQDFNTVNANELNLDDMKGELMNYIEESSSLFEPIPTVKEQQAANENIADFKMVGQINPDTLIKELESGLVVDRKDTVAMASDYGVQFDKQFKQKLYLDDKNSNNFKTYKKDNWVYDNEKPNNGGFIDDSSKLMAYDMGAENYVAL